MSKRNITMVFVLAIAVFAGIAIGGAFSPKDKNQALIEKITKINCDSFDMMKIVNEKLYDTSDLLSRYGHYISPDSHASKLCPECSIGQKPIPGVYVEKENDVMEEIPENLEQMLLDAQEIYSSICCVSSSVNNQSHMLGHNLENLRKE
tara:strand:+ start:116 stop:562 length:447 start_codon:yes stop_codon:yes gene_type:complete